MVNPELTGPHRSRTTKQVLSASAAVGGTTAAAVALALLDPSLAPNTPPHPTLTGSTGEALSIVQNNARVLAAPFLLIALRLHHSAAGRVAGDVVIAGVVAINTISVGLELGRWQTRLLPYLPHLPLEAAALAASTAAWLNARDGHAHPSALAPLAVYTMLLLTGAAALETWCTPHRHTRPTATQQQTDAIHGPHPLVGDSGCDRHGFCAADGLGASRSHAPFPSHSSVPLGRPPGANRAHSNHRPPQGGITT